MGSPEDGSRAGNGRRDGTRDELDRDAHVGHRSWIGWRTDLGDCEEMNLASGRMIDRRDMGWTRTKQREGGQLTPSSSSPGPTA